MTNLVTIKPGTAVVIGSGTSYPYPIPAIAGVNRMKIGIIELYEGDVQSVAFQLQLQGQLGYWNVAAATIAVPVEDEEGNLVTTITCSSVAPGANWASGLVVVDTAAVTAEVPGTYHFTIQVTIGGQVITAGDGYFKVQLSPGGSTG